MPSVGARKLIEVRLVLQVRAAGVLVDPGVLAVGIGAGVVLFVPQRQEIDGLAGFGKDLPSTAPAGLERDRSEHAHQRVGVGVLADVLGLVEVVVAQIGARWPWPCSMSGVGLPLLTVENRSSRTTPNLQAEVVDLVDDGVGAGEQLADVAVRALLAVPVDAARRRRRRTSSAAGDTR